MRTLALALGCWFALTTTALAQVSVEMSADRTTLALGDRVVVRIDVQAQGAGSPEIELPEFEGFQIVQRSVQRPMQFSFSLGQGAPVVSSATHYLFVLQPLDAGRFTIPAVRVKAGKQVYSSRPLTLEVRGGSAGGSVAPQSTPPSAHEPRANDAPRAQGPAAQPSGTPGDAFQYDPEAFLRTVVDKTEPYVGEQVTATVYLYTRTSLQQVPSVQTEPSTDGFWTHDLLTNTRFEPRRQTVAGRGFFVYPLRRFAAFPLRTGELTIGAMTLTLSRETIFDLFDPSRAAPDLKRSGVPVTVRVQPLPTEGKPAGEVAVGRFELEATLDRTQVATGDAVTLKTTLRGRGNVRAIRLPTPEVPGLEILQPETREVVSTERDLVEGTRIASIILVPKRPGTYTIPPLVLHAFDPDEKKYYRVETAPLSLTAAGNAPEGSAQADEALAPSPADENEGDGGEQLTWPPPRAASSLSRKREPLAERPLFAWTAALAPLAFGLGVLLPRLGRRVRAGRRASEERARKAVRSRLREAGAALERGDGVRFHADLASALVQALELRLEETLSGLTRAELQLRLAARGLPEALVGEVLELLAACDFARFAGAKVAASDMQERLARAERACDAIGRSMPRTKESSP